MGRPPSILAVQSTIADYSLVPTLLWDAVCAAKIITL